MRTETFGYDADDDTLTSANYGDGLPGASVSWTYDPMGYRNDAVCDNLNRASSNGGVSMTHDILGNRLTRGTGTYQWDLVNRLTEVRTGTGLGQRTTNFAYRADGMRVHKWGNAALGSMTQPIDLQGTLYRYDGQMLIEEQSDDETYRRYGIGARGIEMISTSAGTDSYPLYDAHGNMVATLSRAGNGGFSFAGERSYDAWGLVRSGGSSGAPSQRYCASLGHVQDEETGLVYMRARYYEPGSGRFVSEDPARDGSNWFVYCRNNPVNGVDPEGRAVHWLVILGLSMLVGALVGAMGGATYSGVLNHGKINPEDVLAGAVMGAFLAAMATGAVLLGSASIAGFIGFSISAATVGEAFEIALIATVVGCTFSGWGGVVTGFAAKAYRAYIGRNLQVGLLLAEMEIE